MHKVYIETYGCELNRADSLLMEKVLINRGYRIVNNINEADIIIINTCTVRKETEERMIYRIKDIYEEYVIKRNKRLIIAGCLPSAQPYLVNLNAPKADLITPQNITLIASVIESPKRQVLILGSRSRSCIPLTKTNLIASIPIADGCLGNCSFCVVKIARRRLVSYPLKLIVRKVMRLVKSGIKEVRLTAQDTGAYGLDIYGKHYLPILLRELIEIPGAFKIRIGMMNPEHLTGIIDDLIELMHSPKIYRFLHIPLQSGDDRVLKIMNRKYTVDEYRSLVKELKRKVPDIAIATDILVGHPGEDEEAFENTVRVVKELEFERIHLARYTVRPRTVSASLPQVPPHIQKERTLRLQRVIEDICLKIHKSYVGSTAKALIIEKGAKGTVIGRLHNYIPVVIKKPAKINLGTYKYVKIDEATYFDIRGHDIDKYASITPLRS